MRYNRPYSINNLIFNISNTSGSSDKKSLLKIKQHAVFIIKLNNVVKSLLPISLRPWCRVANFSNKVLTLETANANWKIRLNYEQPNLLSALKLKILPSLLYINVKINPCLASTQGLNIKSKYNIYQCNQILDGQLRRCLSAQSAAYISNIITFSDGKLKKILERLIKLVSENSTISNSETKC